MSDAGTIDRVPRTPAERDAVLRERPEGWEFLLFAALLYEQEGELEPRWAALGLGALPASSDPPPITEDPASVAERLAAVQAAAEWLGAALRREEEIMGQVPRTMTSERSQQAFGKLGEEGDPGEIARFADDVMKPYRELFDWLDQLRAEQPPSQVLPIFKAAEAFAVQPLEQFRAYIADLLRNFDDLPAALREGRAVGGSFKLSLAIDDEAVERIKREMERVIAENQREADEFARQAEEFHQETDDIARRIDENQHASDELTKLEEELSSDHITPLERLHKEEELERRAEEVHREAQEIARRVDELRSDHATVAPKEPIAGLAPTDPEVSDEHPGPLARLRARGARREAERAERQLDAELAGWQAQRDVLAEELEAAEHFAGDTNSNQFLLQRGEALFAYVASASLVEDRSRGGQWHGRSSGVSVPIGSIGGRSIRYRIGGTRGNYAQSAPVPTAVDVGTLFITNKRAVFQGQRQTRECRYDKLIGLQHSADGSTVFSVSNRQKATVVSYGANLTGWVAFQLDLALAHYRGTVPALVDQLRGELADLDRRRPTH